MAKVSKSKVARPTSGSSSKLKKQSVVKAVAKAEPKLKVVPPAKVAKKQAVAEPSENARQRVAQKLAETLEKRKQEKAAGGGPGKGTNKFFGRPPGRRGRRPKSASEYQPMQQEEDSYVLESEFERLEYDTGIRLKDSAEDGGFSLDRVEDFDEELNFDP